MRRVLVAVVIVGAVVACEPAPPAAAAPYTATVPAADVHGTA